MATYTWLVDSACWGYADSWDVDAHVDACDRAQRWLEGTDRDIYVRPVGEGQVPAIYTGEPGGDLGPLRTVDPEERERINEIINRAWEHALQTWPSPEEEDRQA